MVRPRSPFHRRYDGGEESGARSTPMTRPSMVAVATLGIDIGKNVFHLICFNERGAIASESNCTSIRASGRPGVGRLLRRDLRLRERAFLIRARQSSPCLLLQSRHLPLQPVHPIEKLIEGSSLHRLRGSNRRVPSPTQPRAELSLAFILNHSPCLSCCDAGRRASASFRCEWSRFPRT